MCHDDLEKNKFLVWVYTIYLFGIYWNFLDYVPCYKDYENVSCILI